MYQGSEIAGAQKIKSGASKQMLEHGSGSDLSEIDGALNRLHASVDLLQRLINELENKLTPVSMPIEAATKMSGGNPPSCSSAVGARIDGASQEMESIADRLRTQLGALAV